MEASAAFTVFANSAFARRFASLRTAFVTRTSSMESTLACAPMKASRSLMCSAPFAYTTCWL